MSRAALGLAPAAAALIRDLAPFARFEVDDAIVTSALAAAARQRCEPCGGPPANDRHEQRGPQRVRNKTRKCQKDSTDYGGDAGGLQVHRPHAPFGKGGAEPDEIGAPRANTSPRAAEGAPFTPYARRSSCLPFERL